MVQMGVNFLGHFHLVQLLLPTMQAQSGPSRIVCVACKNEMDGSESLTGVTCVPALLLVSNTVLVEPLLSLRTAGADQAAPPPVAQPCGCRT